MSFVTSCVFVKNSRYSVIMLRESSKFFAIKANGVNFEVYNLVSVSEAYLERAVGKRIKVQGWVRAVRKMKDYSFVDLNDGSTSELLQVVIKKCDQPADLSYGSSVAAEGELTLAPNGKMELCASDIKVMGKCVVTDGYPFYPKKVYSSEYVREFLHFRPRTKTFASILRLRDIATSVIYEHLRSRGFINVDTPIITSNDCEGAGEVFTVKPDSEKILESMKKAGISPDHAYFDTKTYLTVSGQLQLEAAARALTKVFNFGPTFRAENSKSRLHLSEFYMLEAESAFVTTLKDITEEIELLIKSVTRALIKKGATDIRLLEAPEPDWIDKKFGYITYDEAVKILDNHGNHLTFPLKYGDSFSKEHELFLVQHNNGVPIFIVNWPKRIKPFYMRGCQDDASKVEALDLLAPCVGELVGGSLREDSYEKLQSKLPPNRNLAWYLELRKFGNVPTGGFGMGFERYLQFVLNVENIKDTIPFPRWPHNCNL
ncbi:probable asparagine--tRNA ligase, mitochondrial isoform X2 [Belonocnema kinseyi]|uniref:probable asparagine--tRNA ligase, mitochondrial isoform X2 n=1 Tax=Belonocnema kinseyi TaxID=2817044 RepID=UPI00143CE9A6|nr:probable asparagine--tRNA ligase, mitochondrial isoform X2 [Belonocnema kinseyi]